MTKLISQKQAINTMIVLLVIVLVFHILILTEIISYTIVWAGKISNLEEMWLLEGISICINSFLVMLFLLKADYIQNKIPKKILKIIIGLLVGFFSLNTLGNLFAQSKFELYFFTPLTFVSALLCLRIVMDKKLI